jgi:preprotein translocase subunit SecE
MITKWLEFGRGVQREVGKVSWPNQREIIITTVLIFIMAAVASVFFFFVDWGVSKLIRLVLGLGG